MSDFEQPPAQHIEKLQALRSQLVRIVEAFTDELLKHIDVALEYPALEPQDYRANLAAQIGAHELTIARLDREIAALEEAIKALPEVSDTVPEWHLPDPSELPAGRPA